MARKKVFIIAEAGVNHNGSIKKALELIDVASEAGADAVKFQTFKAEDIVTNRAPKADYQKETTGSGGSQLEMIKGLELSEQDHLRLIEAAGRRGIQLLSTPADCGSVDLLIQKLNLQQLKIASGDITNGPLLLKIARTGTPVILSSGMSTIGEIEASLGVLAFGYLKQSQPPSLEEFQRAYNSAAGREKLNEKVALLHCTTEYPAPYEDVNLLAIETLKKTFGLQTGLSDHTLGIAVPIAAAALGAEIIEKHITLDKNLPGPDHRASLSPAELKAMIEAIRQVEAALGDGVKTPAAAELKNLPIARKSIVASRRIEAGEKLTADNMTTKRPGTGISPMLFWSLLNKPVNRTYAADEEID